jgi:superfamily II DNA or RNA helicase
MQALFKAVREACSSRSWSRGVELSRAGAVIGEHTSTAELTLKVATQVGMAYTTVTLWPDEVDWSCDCETSEDACAHVAAAVIALRRAGEAGKTMPAPKTVPGRIGYRFSRHDRSLVFRRVVVRNGASAPLEYSLKALAAGQVDAPPVVITQGDQEVERALGSYDQGGLSRERVPGLLKALGQCTDVRLDGCPVRTSSAAVVPQVSVTDQAHGFLLRLEPDPHVTEVFKNGIVLCGDTLRPLGESGLTARQRAELPAGRFYALDEVAELVTNVLPALRKRLPVQVRTTRLPDEAVTPPRVVIDSQRRGETLELLPRLVYGDPPAAYIEEGRLVHVGGTVPLRDEDAERQLVRRLRTELGLVPGQAAHFTGEEAVELVQRLRPWSGALRGGGHKAFELAPPLAPRLRLEAGQFDLFFVPEGPGASRRDARARVSAAMVLRAWQQGALVLPLPQGGWAPLPVDWLERFGPRVADLLAARDAAGRLPTCALPDLARLCDALERPRPPEMASLSTLVEDFDGIPAARLPDDLQATLRAYQRRGVDWLVLLRRAGLGALLADDMGLGKTVQTLCTVGGRTLVVAPTSVLHNWADEIRRFRPALRAAIYHGPQRQLDATADVTLTTYAILRLDIDVLAPQEWETVVLDEAQTIKNPDSQVAGAAYRLRAPFRLALSGTPVENRLEELWSLMHFLNPGLLGGLRDFQERYARPIVAGQSGVASRLRERIKPFVLRRRKQDVAAELPPRTDTVLHCVLDEDERQVYEAVRAATREQVVARLEAGGSVLDALEALLRLRQACCHSGLVPGQEAASSSKVTLLLEALEQIVAEDHKALVFSQWTSLLDRLEPHLRAAGMAFERLDGSTRDRAGVVRRFQDQAGPPVMLVSLRAGGLGLNLTAADHVFLLDPWWNPAVEEQAADRAHRLGQERPVLVYRLVAEDTVEERMLALQEHKRALAATALGGASQAVALSREDLLALLA